MASYRIQVQATYDHRPVIPITLRNGTTTIECQALIDSGATYTLFPSSLAAKLGLDLANAKTQPFIGIKPGKEGKIIGYEALVDIGIGDTLYQATMYFSPDLEQDKPGMLGQIGFFDRFKVTIEGKTVLVEEKATKPPEQETHLEPVILGNDIETSQPVMLKQEARQRGLYVIGKTGTGKTNLLVNLTLQDIEQGMGVCFITPHSDAIEDILKRFPDSRRDDVILLDPLDKDYAFGLNNFECHDPTNEEQVDLLVSYLLEVFAKLFTKEGSFDTEATNMELTLRNAAYVLIDNFLTYGVTMAEIPLLIEEEDVRERLILNISRSETSRFWKRYNRLTQAEKDKITGSTYTRVNRFLSNPFIKRIVGQSKTTLDFRKIMDGKKILLVKLPRQHREITNLVGSLIVAQIADAAFSREDTPEDKRVQFNLYADEYQRFATPTFAELLAEVRKYKIATTVAHQWRQQLDVDNRKATLNAGTLVVFEVSGEDGEELAKQFKAEPQEKPGELRYEPIMQPVIETYKEWGWDTPESEQAWSELCQKYEDLKKVPWKGKRIAFQRNPDIPGYIHDITQYIKEVNCVIHHPLDYIHYVLAECIKDTFELGRDFNEARIIDMLRFNQLFYPDFSDANAKQYLSDTLYAPGSTMQNPQLKNPAQQTYHFPSHLPTPLEKQLEMIARKGLEPDIGLFIRAVYGGSQRIPDYWADIRLDDTKVKDAAKTFLAWLREGTDDHDIVRPYRPSELMGQPYYPGVKLGFLHPGIMLFYTVETPQDYAMYKDKKRDYWEWLCSHFPGLTQLKKDAVYRFEPQGNAEGIIPLKRIYGTEQAPQALENFLEALDAIRKKEGAEFKRLQHVLKYSLKPNRKGLEWEVRYYTDREHTHVNRLDPYQDRVYVDDLWNPSLSRWLKRHTPYIKLYYRVKRAHLERRIQEYKTQIAAYHTLLTEKLEQLGLDVFYFLVQDTRPPEERYVKWYIELDMYLDLFLDAKNSHTTAWGSMTSEKPEEAKAKYLKRKMKAYLTYVATYGYGYWHVPDMSQAIDWFKWRLQEIRDITNDFHKHIDRIIAEAANLWMNHYKELTKERIVPGQYKPISDHEWRRGGRFGHEERSTISEPTFRPGPMESMADAEKRVANELANPSKKYTARVKLESGEEHIIVIEQTEAFRPAAASSVVLTRTHQIIEQTRKLYCKKRTDVEQELIARQDELTKPLKKEARANTGDEKLTPEQLKKLKGI